MAQSSNRPFTTIEPNSSVVRVPDERLVRLAEEVRAVKVTEAQVDFIDIAGLVAGASEGKGLGNKFLANIAAVHSIVHVVRCFEDDSITHVEGNPDPIRDLGIIEQELIYKDLATIDSSIRRKRPRGSLAEAQLWESTLDKTLSFLEHDKPALGARRLLTDEEFELFDSWRLLSAKPILIACNVDENSAGKGNRLSQLVMDWHKAKREQEAQESEKLQKSAIGNLSAAAKSVNHIFNVSPVVVCAKLESELMILEDDVKKRQELFLQYGLSESALTHIIRGSYQLLDLMTFYTAGPTEARAWPVRRGATAKECAGEIHSDIALGFVKAETYSFSDFITLGEKKAKEMNKLRLEGPNYVAQDGDIFLFKFKGAR